MKAPVLAAVLAAASLAPLPALAANDTITVTITTVAAGCSSGCSRTLNGPVGVNLIPLMLSTYQQPCNASINGACTPAQVFNYYIGTIGANLRNDIRDAQTASATASATAGIITVPVQ